MFTKKANFVYKPYIGKREKNLLIEKQTKNNIYLLIYNNKTDWRERGCNTTVKDQGPCGSCWSFSVAGAIECQVRTKLKQNVTLSPQYLIDCCGYPYYDLYGCDGGNTNF